jgi:tellurite methyltransferase
MERRIVNFHVDTEGDWVADLDCGHRQHVRHRPPFQVRPWVLDETERAAHVGSPLDCALCERGEMPDGLRFAWRTAAWDAKSLPAGLRRRHKLGPHTWGRIVVEEGSLAYRASTTPPMARVIGAGRDQAIPPGVEHDVEPADDARFLIEFFDVTPCETSPPPDGVGDDAPPPDAEDGGDPPCWAHLFCPECGNELTDGHLRSCSSA